MQDDDELRINTLERFEKGRKSRLVLEEYSHCEVPAGCGGVVLRWRDPAAGRSLLLLLQGPATMQVHIDGERIECARTSLGFGEHLLALTVVVPPETRPAPRWLPLLFAAQVDGPDERDRRPLEALLSRGDSSWRATSERPADDTWCREPSFDDESWAPLASTKLPRLPEQLRWLYERVAAAGATPLLLPRGALWLRKRFTLRVDER